MTTEEEKSSNESDLHSQISNVIKGGGGGFRKKLGCCMGGGGGGGGGSFWRNCGAASVGEYE